MVSLAPSTVREVSTVLSSPGPGKPSTSARASLQSSRRRSLLPIPDTGTYFASHCQSFCTHLSSDFYRACRIRCSIYRVHRVRCSIHRVMVHQPRPPSRMALLPRPLIVRHYLVFCLPLMFCCRCLSRAVHFHPPPRLHRAQLGLKAKYLTLGESEKTFLGNENTSM